MAQYNFKDLTEREEKEFCFEVLSRSRHIPEFFDELKLLMEKFPSPYNDTGIVRELKEEFKNCKCQ